MRWLTLLLALPLAALAQPDARHFPLERVNVNGSQRYPESAIVAAMGLRVGQQCSEAQLQQVSAKLGNTGLFDSVEFRFGWGSLGVVATFNVKDSTKLVPIGFENMVWFSRNELANLIKRKLPLFTGVVPLGGDYKDQIAGVLERILVEHKLKGTVVALPQGKPDNVTAMLYRVEGHEIEVVDCEFPGSTHANRLEIYELTKFVQRMRYEKSLVDAALQSRLRDIYDSDGYLSASFSTAELKVVSVAPDRTRITLSTRVTEGREYTFSGVEWSGNTVYSAADLDAALKFPTGRPASTLKFRDSLVHIRRLYGKRGYLGLNMEVTPRLSRDGTARFVVAVREDGQYRVGKVSVNGVDDGTVARMMSEWTNKPGDVYDATYPQMFMAMTFPKFAPGAKWEWKNVESVHEDRKTVDVTIEIYLQK